MSDIGKKLAKQPLHPKIERLKVKFELMFLNILKFVKRQYNFTTYSSIKIEKNVTVKNQE